MDTCVLWLALLIRRHVNVIYSCKSFGIFLDHFILHQRRLNKSTAQLVNYNGIVYLKFSTLCPFYTQHCQYLFSLYLWCGFACHSLPDTFCPVLIVLVVQKVWITQKQLKFSVRKVTCFYMACGAASPEELFYTYVHSWEEDEGQINEVLLYAQIHSLGLCMDWALEKKKSFSGTLSLVSFFDLLTGSFRHFVSTVAIFICELYTVRLHVTG